jgi:hypothetical protein
MGRKVKVVIDSGEEYPVFSVEPLKGRKAGAWENVVTVEASTLKRWKDVIAAANAVNVELGEIHDRLETERQNRALAAKREAFRYASGNAVLMKGKAIIGLLFEDDTLYEEQVVPNDSKTVTWYAVPPGKIIVGYQSRIATPKAILKAFPEYKKEIVLKVRLPESVQANGGDITLQFQQGIHLLT